MPRWALFLILFLAGSPLFGQVNELDQVAAIQRVMERAISQAEPSIACILVSRSEGYRKLGIPIAPFSTGKLGSFDANILGNYSPEEARALRRKFDLSDAGHIPESFGSGIVIDPQGLILTNYHVVQDAVKIYVRLPGGKGSYADIQAGDARCDLAVLKLLNPKILPLKALPLGDASLLERGHWILSLANPFAAGFRDGQPSASWGILSNIRRRYPGSWKEEDRATKPLSHYGTLLQVDARLNLGCSGGALLNLKSECVGLTSALAGIEGGETSGGFAIPLDRGMRNIIEVLKRGEEVEYGFLGIRLPEPDRIPEGSPGVPITGVFPGSPANLEGGLHGANDLRLTDMIIAVNGQAIQEGDDLLATLGPQLAGTKVKLDVLKNGKDRKTVEVTLAKFYTPGKRVVTSLGKRPFFKGLRVDYTSLLVQQPGRIRDGIPTGVLIAEIEPNSSASKAELRIDEVITHVNHTPVQSPSQFYEAVQKTRGQVELTIRHLNSPEAPVDVKLK